MDDIQIMKIGQSPDQLVNEFADNVLVEAGWTFF